MQTTETKQKWELQSYLINPKLWMHIFVDVRIEFDSPPFPSEALTTCTAMLWIAVCILPNP